MIFCCGSFSSCDIQMFHISKCSLPPPAASWCYLITGGGVRGAQEQPMALRMLRRR
jgi:hypothetical protein